MLGPLAVVCAAVACGGSSGGTTQPTPATPAPAAPVSVTGSWSGSASDSSGPGQMIWQLTQTDASFSGTVRVTDTTTGAVGNGSVSGTLTGSTLQFSIAIPAGGFPSPYAACTANVSGSGQATSSTITGTYTGASSCAGTIGSGQFSLNK